ncbi:MAG: amphi-Trp domain-containing protein [Lentisphaeria bacterium]|jgi:amphi-Trp domain-containing protein
MRGDSILRGIDVSEEKNDFRFESLEDRKSIRKILEAMADGFDGGALSFSDDQGGISMSPDGLLHIKLNAEKEDGQNRINLRVTWQEPDDKILKNKTLKINKKNIKK